MMLFARLFPRMSWRELQLLLTIMGYVSHRHTCTLDVMVYVIQRYTCILSVLS